MPPCRHLPGPPVGEKAKSASRGLACPALEREGRKAQKAWETQPLPSENPFPSPIMPS